MKREFYVNCRALGIPAAYIKAETAHEAATIYDSLYIKTGPPVYVRTDHPSEFTKGKYYWFFVSNLSAHEIVVWEVN